MTVQDARGSDHQLIAAVCAGNAQAFEALYDRYVEEAYGLAFSICRDRGLAQEAVQEAFLSVWRAGASFSAQQGSLAAWLFTIVRHRSIDVARHNRRHALRRASADGLEALPADTQAADVAMRHEFDSQLHASLARLPDAQRQVITLAFFDQLSHAEIADALELPSGTVKGRMRLGMDKLRITVERPAP